MSSLSEAQKVVRHGAIRVTTEAIEEALKLAQQLTRPTYRQQVIVMWPMLQLANNSSSKILRRLD